MKRRFRVAPSGKAIGLLRTSSGGKSLTIVVYPKLWQKKPALRRLSWPSNQENLIVAAAELDVVEIEADPGLFESLESLEGDGRFSPDPLLGPLVGRVADVPEEDDADHDPIRVLIALESLLRWLSLESMFCPDSRFARPLMNEPLLRPILYRLFLDEVSRQLIHAKRGYVWTDEDLGTIRGRASSESVVVALATGWPRFQCRFQDFTRSTPTLIAICSALEVIAGDHASESPIYTALGDLRNESVGLRRFLLDVPSVLPAQALGATIGVLRERRSSAWIQALEIGAGILWPDSGIELGESELNFELSIDSSRIWELILLAVFRRRGLNAVDGNSPDDEVLRVSRPWENLGTKPPRPDLVVRGGSRAIILDGKYKSLEGVPAAEDLYQMFAYSHLASVVDVGEVSELELVYPARNDSDVKRLGPYTRSGDESRSLSIRTIRFPTITECVSGWDSYLGAQASMLGDFKIG